MKRISRRRATSFDRALFGQVHHEKATRQPDSITQQPILLVHTPLPVRSTNRAIDHFLSQILCIHAWLPTDFAHQASIQATVALVQNLPCHLIIENTYDPSSDYDSLDQSVSLSVCVISLPPNFLCENFLFRDEIDQMGKGQQSKMQMC
uniref:Uncharacterized protein n=1 Tax=Oryza rufipogon TaxID=4529 RepID=A0A0E0R3G4_ORYRU